MYLQFFSGHASVAKFTFRKFAFLKKNKKNKKKLPIVKSQSAFYV